MPQSVLGKSITISLVLHAGLLGLLVFESPKHSMLTNTPLRVRILEPPAPQVSPEAASPAPPRALPQPPPPVTDRPQAAREPVEVLRPLPPPAGPESKLEAPTERSSPPPSPVPDEPATPPVPPQAAPEPVPQPIPQAPPPLARPAAETVSPPPPPQVAAPLRPEPMVPPPPPQVVPRPTSEPVAPRAVKIPEAPREIPLPTPERGIASLDRPLPAPDKVAPPPPPPQVVARAETKPETPSERLAPPPLPIPEKPVAPPAPPQVASRPRPEPAVPQPQRIPEPPRKEAPVTPDQSGLSLGGPPPSALPLPRVKGSPPPAAPARPSLREQIDSLGSGVLADAGASAKQTVNLDNREDRFVEYLARLKRRIQRGWTYPEEALEHGVGGELLLVFTLNKAGTLTNIRLVQSSGFPVLDEEALRAVKVAAPFDPLPPQMGEDPWNIRAFFHYNHPRHSRRN